MEVKAKEAALDQKALQAIVRYCPDTGQFTWTDAVRKRWRGRPAGSWSKRGYLYIAIKGYTYLGHRLAVLYMTGVWPGPEVDHRDGDSGNNRWLNLRDATREGNCSNRVSNRNKHGYPGVREVIGGFTASVGHNKKRHYLGFFPTAEEANAAAVAGRLALHKQFAVENRST